MWRIESRFEMLAANFDWHDRLDGERAKYPVTLGGKPVEFVKAGDLRGMEGNLVEMDKVQALRSEQYQNPIILDYSCTSGQGYISEGNHRLAARENDDLVPLYIHVVNRRIDFGRPFTQPGELIDEYDYCPSYLYPTELGFTTYPAPYDPTDSPSRYWDGEKFVE